MINIPLNKILFIDIETVGIESNWVSFTNNYPELSSKFEGYMDWFKKRFPECSTRLVEQNQWQHLLFAGLQEGQNFESFV
jgi:hypothetical protein